MHLFSKSLARYILLLFSLIMFVPSSRSQSQVASSIILDIKWHPSGEIYAQLDSGGLLKVIDPLTDQILFEFDAGEFTLSKAQVTWTTDGDKLAAGIGSYIYMWETLNWQLIQSYIAGAADGKAYNESIGEIVDDAIISLVWSQNDAYLLSASFIRILIWDTNLEIATYEDIPSSGNLYPYIWAQEETKLTNGMAYIDLQSKELFLLNPLIGYLNRGTVVSSQLNRDRSVILNASSTGYIELIDANNFTIISLIHLAPGFSGEPPRARIISDVDWNASEDFIVVVTRDGEIRVVNLVTEEIETVATGLGTLYAIDWNPISNEIIYSGISEAGQPILETVDVTGIAGVPPIIGPLTISPQDQSNLLFGGEFDRTEEFKWSSDSIFLAFYNYDLGSTSAPLSVNTESAGWQTVDISTGLLSSGTNLWPFQPVLAPREISLFMPHEFVYTSPDSNLMIFGQEPADDIGLRKITLANRDTLQVVSLDIFSAANPFNPMGFNVQWGENNRTATVAFNSFSGTQRVFHIDIPNVHHLQDVVIKEFGAEINGNTYILAPTSEDKFLDLSTDGRGVFLVVRDSTVTGLTTIYDNPPQLLIWRPYTNDVEIVNADIVIDGAINGSFAANNSDILFFTTSQGLLAHNITTDTTRQLLDSERIENSYNIFSPDGRWLAIAKSNSFEILSLNDLMIENPPNESDGSSAVSESGEITSTAIAGVIVVDNVLEPTPIPVILTELKYSPNGEYIAGGGFNTLKIWDSANGALVFDITPYINESDVIDLTWSPDNTRLAVAFGDQFVRIWNVTDLSSTSGILLAEFEPFAGSANLLKSIDWHSSEEILAIAGFNLQPQIRFWDTRSYTLIGRSGGSLDISQLSWKPFSDMLAALNYEGGTSFFIPMGSNQNGYSICPSGCESEYASSLAWNGDGTQLALGYADGEVYIVDSATNQEILSFDGEGYVTQIAWRADNKLLAIARSANNPITLWDTSSGQVFETEAVSLVVDFNPVTSDLAFYDNLTGTLVIEDIAHYTDKPTPSPTATPVDSD